LGFDNALKKGKSIDLSIYIDYSRLLTNYLTKTVRNHDFTPPSVYGVPDEYVESKIEILKSNFLDLEIFEISEEHQLNIFIAAARSGRSVYNTLAKTVRGFA
jgi:hypothetical protein